MSNSLPRKSEVMSDFLRPHGLWLPGSSVHGIFQARVPEWVAISSPANLPDPGIAPRSPALQAETLPSEPPGFPGGSETNTDYSVIFETAHKY